MRSVHSFVYGLKAYLYKQYSLTNLYFYTSNCSTRTSNLLITTKHNMHTYMRQLYSVIVKQFDAADSSRPPLSLSFYRPAELILKLNRLESQRFQVSHSPIVSVITRHSSAHDYDQAISYNSKQETTARKPYSITSLPKGRNISYLNPSRVKSDCPDRNIQVCWGNGCRNCYGDLWPPGKGQAETPCSSQIHSVILQQSSRLPACPGSPPGPFYRPILLAPWILRGQERKSRKCQEKRQACVLIIW